MSVSISNTPPTAGSAAPMRVMAPARPMREALVDLGQALRQDDLAAAQQAYAAVVKSAPEGMTVSRGSAFAQLGGALARGDLEAAKAVYGDKLRERLEARRDDPVSRPAPTPIPIATHAAPHGPLGNRLSILA